VRSLSASSGARRLPYVRNSQMLRRLNTALARFRPRTSIPPAGEQDAFSLIFTAFEAGEVLAACAWCGRVRIEGRWIVPPPAALAAIDTRNTLSHSICDECARGR